MFKKFLALIFALALITPTFAQDQEPLEPLQIPDIPTGHWVEGYANYLVEQGFMTLSEEGNFLPDASVTRSQMVNIILKQTTATLETPDEATFADVPTDHPLFAMIETAFQLGIIKGVSNDDSTLSFHPDALVTRSQFVKIILSANHIDIPAVISQSDFPDVDLENWAAPFIHIAHQLGFINGYSNGNFGPDDSLTRAQVAKVIYLFLASTDQIIADSVVTSGSTAIESQTGITAYDQLALSLINTSRSEQGKLPLQIDPTLSKIARRHATWLSDHSIKSSHTGAGDSSPFDRLRTAEIDYLTAAENVGWATANIQDVASALVSIHSSMMSEPDATSEADINHKANILGSFFDFNKVGIGVVISETANSKEVRIVQIFIESR